MGGTRTAGGHDLSRHLKMSNPKRSVFNCDWINKTLNPEFASWIKPVAADRHQANCTVCMKNFELSNMGRRAVTSHLKSATHTKRSQSGTGCYNISSLLTSKKTKQQDVASSSSLSSSADASTSQTSVEAPMTSSDVNTSSPST